MFRNHIVVCLVAGWTLAPGSILAAEPKIVEVIDSWYKRQQQFRSVYYHVVGETSWPGGSVIGSDGRRAAKQAPNDRNGPFEHWIRLDFEKGRHRWESGKMLLNASTDQLNKCTEIRTFNGRVFAGMDRNEANDQVAVSTKGGEPKLPDVTISSGFMEPCRFTANQMPVLHAHGLIARPLHQIVPGQLRKRADPDYLFWHGQTVFRGKRVEVVRTETVKVGATNMFEYWIDPGLGNLIVRERLFVNDEVYNDAEIEYQESPHGLVLAGWTHSHISGGRIRFTERARVVDYSVNQAEPDNTFEIEIKKGMRVRQIENLAPAEASETRTESTFVAEYDTTSGQLGTASSSQYRSLRRIAGILMLIALMGLSFLVWRRARARASSHP
jgi:hypothetical protein